MKKTPKSKQFKNQADKALKNASAVKAKRQGKKLARHGKKQINQKANQLGWLQTFKNKPSRLKHPLKARKNYHTKRKVGLAGGIGLVVALLAAVGFKKRRTDFEADD